MSRPVIFVVVVLVALSIGTPLAAAQSVETETLAEDDDEPREVMETVAGVEVVGLQVEDGEARVVIHSPRNQTVSVMYESSRGEGGITDVEIGAGETVAVTVPSSRSEVIVSAGSEWVRVRSGNGSLMDLPPSEWVYSYITLVFAPVGAILGVLYVYRAKVYHFSDELQSIFDIEWWS